MAYIEERTHNQGGTTFRVIWRENGKRQQQGFTDREAADEFRNHVQANPRQDRWPTGWLPGQGWAVDVADEDAPTFAEWAKRAITRRTKANPRTKADYRRDIERHMGVFAHLRLTRITDDHVAQWVDQLVADGKAPKTVANLQGLASSIMDDAMKNRPPLVDYNPFAGVLPTLPRSRTEDMNALSYQEFLVILGHMRPEYVSLTKLLYQTGLRWSEATALRVRNLDLLGRGTLTVEQAWKRQPDGTHKMGEPKTRHSRRTIRLARDTIDMLLAEVAGKRGDALVFTSATGLPVLHSTFYERGWKRAVAYARVCPTHLAEQNLDQAKSNHKRRVFEALPKACHCPGVLDKTPRVHSLRHSHVMFLIESGAALPRIQRRLGHSSIQTTIDRYGHLLPEGDDSVTDAIDAVFSEV